MFVSTVTRSRGRRRFVAVLLVAGAIAGLLAVAGAALAVSEGGKLPGRTVVGGVAVGGVTEATARRRLTREAEAQRRRPIELRSDHAATVTVTGALLGAEPLVDQALEAADGSSLPERVARRLGFGDARVVPLRYRFDPERLDRLHRELDARIAVEPKDARLTVRANGASVEPAQPGRKVDADTLRRALRSLPPSATIPLTVVEPGVSTDEARRSAAMVDALLSTPRAVAIGTTAVALQRPFLRRALIVESGDGTLAVRLDTEMLRRRLEPAFRDRLRRPRDAAFRVDGKRIAIAPSAPGRELAVGAIGRSLLEKPRQMVHLARFRPVTPALTTREARQLRIDEKVSEFTTYYPCCAPRVTNIQRAAQILDGTVVRPGARFSLNDALGERTSERGFVLAPQIRAGRLEDAVGGGVSQVATTLYNAAFFAGLRLDAHQPHQFYISRYPMGREATVSWGGPELIFTNDWKAGLLIKVSAWSTGITVRFYSAKLGRRVETETGEPYSYVSPVTRIVKNPSLRPGERNVLQEAGPAGFTVEYTRRVYRGDELIKDERYRTRYQAENAYVEVGPPKKPKPKPDPGEVEPGDAPPGAGGSTGPPDVPAPPAALTGTSPQ